jgi:hypothetical protein
MRTNILWTGREYYSLENCLVKTSTNGAEIESVIVGLYQEKIYRASYYIATDRLWQTTTLEIHFRHQGTCQELKLKSIGDGKWQLNGQPDSRLDGCTDVDIAITPFTNTLPIRRLALPQGDIREVNVVYFALLGNDIRAVRQKYIRLSSDTYHYENIPNDFEADIKVDEHGLVVDYPLLFIRTAIEREGGDA